ncbi:CHD3-type chromatin-remodeling factor CHR7-like [Bidens hawaiensis]|uniref:CHD3-type chromatin-remodeling factor CHR7-like n=1 Tax=Bidens hawaiensis TaxID=980011 RepID=UPI00404A85D0
MNVDGSYSGLSGAQKREKLMDLIERRRTAPKEHDTNNVKSYEKESMKRKKFNSHFYKKFIRIRKTKAKVLNDTNDTPAAESCSRKRQRLRHGHRFGGRVRQSGTKDKIQSGISELADFQFEASNETHNHILPCVNKLRDHRNRGQNAVFFDGHERVVKVVAFVSSLLDNTKKPVLIIASLGALSLWEIEFSRWSKSVNVVTYKGDKDARAAIRGSGFQVLISSLDVIVEDMEMFDHIKWELLVIDECQRPVFSTHLNKIQMLMADMKLLTVSGESVVSSVNSFFLTRAKRETGQIGQTG